MYKALFTVFIGIKKKKWMYHVYQIVKSSKWLDKKDEKKYILNSKAVFSKQGIFLWFLALQVGENLAVTIGVIKPICSYLVVKFHKISRNYFNSKSRQME